MMSSHPFNHGHLGEPLAMAGRARPKLLICVVAFDAQATLAGVLRRVPRSLFSEFFCEILVIDDASSDATFTVGANYVRTNVDVPIRMLHNARNRGYGGSQKVGYTYAIEHGFEFVALVHGDGQYAPECLPDLLQPLVRGEADAVLGSRMLTPGGARQGGMPLYKFVGNRILTRIQNALLNTNLSEFHTGYRLYRVTALMQIEFLLNTDDFHFDTEIIIQLLNAGARIGERAIPTHYGDEICHVNGLRYARDVLRVTLLNVAHRAGVRHVQRFAPNRMLNKPLENETGGRTEGGMTDFKNLQLRCTPGVKHALEPAQGLTRRQPLHTADHHG